MRATFRHTYIGAALIALATVLAATQATADMASDRAAERAAERAERDGELFRQFFNSTDHHYQVREILLSDEKRLSPNCGDVSVLGVADFFSYEAPTFLATPDSPHSGRWVERYRVRVCGVETKRSASFEAANGHLSGIAHLPGTSMIPPQLYERLLRSVPALAAAAIAETSGSACEESLTITDTVLSMRLTPYADAPAAVVGDLGQLAGQAMSVWSEEWNFRGCGHTATLEITFVVLTTNEIAHIARLKRAPPSLSPPS